MSRWIAMTASALAVLLVLSLALHSASDKSAHSSNILPALEGYAVRIAYLIPANRTAQVDGVSRLQETILAYQAWYRDQMERNGFGPKTFQIEMEADGRTPKIHVLSIEQRDSDLREDLWTRTVSAAAAAGVPVWKPRQIWWLIPEAHLLKPDGTLIGGTALGASFGSGDDGGVGMIGSDGLVRMKREYMTDNRDYAGLILPELGPHPMVQDLTFPSFEQSTISSVCSAIVGAGLHELSHAFGLPHNFRNDENMYGNLMGNGLRGWRGALYPDRYPTDYVRLSFGNALFLNYSRYFNAGETFDDQIKPEVQIQSSGELQTTNGTLSIEFRATDTGGLAAAWLLWKGDLVDAMSLSGMMTTQRFHTPYFSSGSKYDVIVVDRQGNRSKASRSFRIVPSDGNAAPIPRVIVKPPYPTVGQPITLNASKSRDSNHATAALQVQWDFDNDGVFDTEFSTEKQLTRTWDKPGLYMVRARLRDPAGAAALSEPIGFRVLPSGGESDPLNLEKRFGVK